MDTERVVLVNEGKLQTRLGYRFRHPELLALSLTHRSWKEERGGGDNERLEFLGDAVLELVVTEHLVERFPEASEGVLSPARSELVRKSTLAQIGRRWGLGEVLRLGRGEEASGGREKDSLLANALEAVLGALYQDGGLEVCRGVLVPELELVLDGIQDLESFGRNPKSALQELSVELWGVTPRYQEIDSEGPPHARRFCFEVAVTDRVSARGWGGSKKGAERRAAEEALSLVRALAAEE